LDNQEAAILVGYHTPILSSTLTAPTTAGQEATVAQTLDYYQEIGIRLNVVPQVNEDGYINLLVHPSVTSSTSTVTATNQVGSGSANQISTSYPIIDVREAQTQILLKDGETIVMGGLLKDVKSKQTIGIPFLSKIPFFGLIFQREIDDIQKVDLLIFITARIVKEGDFTPEEIARMEKELGKDRTVKAEFNSKKKNKKQKAKAEPLSPAKEL
jgi:type II secretory pathway component GspD/PulD (secretin)